MTRYPHRILSKLVNPSASHKKYQEPQEVKPKERRRRKKKVSAFTGRPFVRLAGGEWATGRYEGAGGASRARRRLRLRLGGQRAAERGREQRGERRGPLLRRGRRNAGPSRGGWGRGGGLSRRGGGGGGGGGDALAGGTHGQEGGGREVHVEGVHRLERAQLRQLLLQPPVLLGERLAAAL